MTTVSRRSIVQGLGSLALLPPFAVAGRAQEQVLRIVFPFAAGGVSDGLLRHLAERLQAGLGRPVIVENKPGAGGRLGALAVKDAPPDGSTLLLAAGAQMFLQPHAFPNLGYDPFVDFVPLTQAWTFDQAAAVGTHIPARTLGELAAWFKAHPDQAIYGTPGAGTGAHFAGVEFARLAKVELRHAPYRGTPAALPDLIAGRLPAYIASAAELNEQYKAGAIRILATLDAQRSPFRPEVPTFRESGFDIVAPAWFAFQARAQTPKPALERLQKAIVAVLHTSEMQEKVRALGLLPTGTTAEEAMRLQRAEYERWGPIVKASGYRGEQ